MNMMPMHTILSRPVPPPAAGPTPRPPVGASISLGKNLPIDLDLPGAPRNFYEVGPIRFKILLDGKYEAGIGVKGTYVNQSNELKVDPAKRSASFKTGIKAEFNGVYTQAMGKISPDSIAGFGAALADPKKFGLALIKYLDVVIGHNFKIPSEYMSFVGVGFALDTDMCFLSMLLPMRLPAAKFTKDALYAHGTIVGDVVIKVGPSKELMKQLVKKFGARTMWKWYLRFMARCAAELPKAVTTTGSVATLSAAMEAAAVWFGAFSMAIPISLAITDFMLHVTRSAREAGVRDAETLNHCLRYVRAVYGLEDLRSGVWTQTEAAALKLAEEHMAEHGVVGMQKWLEQKFYDGMPCADHKGENPNRIAVKVMAERMWLHMTGRRR